MSAVSAVLGRQFLSPRHRARLESQRVATTTTTVDDEEVAYDEEGSFINNSNTTMSSGDGTTTAPNETTNNNNDDLDIEQGGGDRGNDPESSAEEEAEHTHSEDHEAEETVGINRFAVRPTMTLAELEEERELARRRSSACVLFALFVLFRLWVLALQEGDFGLLLLCLVGTSWTARWIRYNRDQEEELDRRIANYLENNENGGNRNEVARDDMRMLSFQAQLALAIMESQRQMMQGGYGHPDSDGTHNPGVSDEAKAAWTKFSYKAARDKVESRRGSYGSVAQEDTLKLASDEEPHCSICLGEYEEGEELTKLPCSHIYHDECIGSWTQHHIRCPLCNYNLETSGVAAEESV